MGALYIDIKTTTKSKAVCNAIEHAKFKCSDITVIYDKFGKLTKDDVCDGILEYESHITNNYRAKEIIVIDNEMNISTFHHEK